MNLYMDCAREIRAMLERQGASYAFIAERYFGVYHPEFTDVQRGAVAVAYDTLYKPLAPSLMAKATLVMLLSAAYSRS